MSNTSFYVKSKLEKIKNGMDLVKFLMSEGYRYFLQKTVWGVTGNYDLKVIFSQGVYTDNKVISVNPVHPYVLSLKELAKMTLCILGQLAHEIFHILYTDFRTLQEIERKYKQYGNFRMKQVHESMNIIEDSAIELAGTNYYTGSFRQAIIVNNQTALENMPSLDDLLIKGAPRLSIFKQACAMYCILGTMKGKLHDPELIVMFKKAMPILDKGRLSPNSWGRLAAAEELYNLMMPLIEEVEQQAKQQQAQQNYKYTKNEQISSGGPSQQPEEQPQVQQDFQKSNKKKTKEEIEEEDNQYGSEEAEETKSSSNKNTNEENTENDEENNEENASGEADDDKKSDEEDTLNGNGSSKEEDEGDGEEEKNNSESGGSGDDKGEEEDNSKSDANERATEDTNEKNSVSENDDEEKTPESQDDAEEDDDEADKEELDEILKNLGDQLETVKTDVAKDEYDRLEQLQQDKKIREFGKNVSYSNLHRHIRVESNRDFIVDDGVKQHYETMYEPIKGLTRNLSKKLLEVIKFNEDAKYTGLYTGKINKSQLYRADKKLFYQNKSKSDEADLVVEMLVDQSGSMSGDRIRYARLACMMMYEVCTALNIPFAVIGHAAVHRSNRVVHRHYVDFDSRDRNEKYKLASMTTYDNTREGVSLKYAGEYLKTRKETDKILIAISDGDPYHPSANDIYADGIAQKDTGRVVKELESDGIKIFGVAIGDGKSAIKQIYTHNYIDIPNINLLPAKLVSLIERNILK